MQAYFVLDNNQTFKFIIQHQSAHFKYYKRI